MTYREHRWFTPTVQFQPEILELYRTTYQFYEEARHREAFDRYCDWYVTIAEQNRREHEKMRGDINIFGWFARKR